MQARTIGAIILAAGSSTRMGEGRHKLLLPLGGKPVLSYVVDAVCASQARPIVIVLGHQAEKVRASLLPYEQDCALTYRENPAYSQGMSSSLRVGIQALLEQGEHTPQAARQIEGALILLGDQPLITTHVIDRLIAAKQQTNKRIIASLYDGKRGNPVLFDASLFPELLAVSGDEGGRSVIEQHRAEMATIEAGSAQASYDVDTWEAYQQVVAAWHSRQEH